MARGFPLTSGPVAFFLALDQGVAFRRGCRGRLDDGRRGSGRVLCRLWAPGARASLGGAARGREPGVRARERGAPARDPGASPASGARGRRARRGAALHAEGCREPAPGTETTVGHPGPDRRDDDDRAGADRARDRARAVTTGLLATYPLYGAILSGFAHHLEGPGPAVRVLRGLLLGLFAFAGFFSSCSRC